MPSNYPASFDSFENPTATDSLNDARVPHAKQHDDANDAIEAIEATLGLHPQGTSATVDARITKVEGRALPATAPATGAPAKSPDMGKTPVVQADGSYALGAASGGGATLSDAAPHDPGATAAAGTGTKASRDDHVHQREIPMLKPADKIGAVLTLDAGRTAAWVDPLALATVVPADLATTAKIGTATEAAKADHVHALPLATTAPSDPAAVAAKGVAELAARADHQHKAELPAHVAADANKVLTVDASGTTVAWKPTTDVTELKSAVANEAALPATGNTTGDIRVTLDDGNMHVWVAATVTPAVAAHWDKIGPAAANVSMATAAPLDPAAVAAVGTSLAAAREDHVHKAELPAHVLADASKHLAVDAAGTGVEWVTPPTELPVSAAADKGKILTLDATGLKPIWEKAPEELPAYTVADKDKVLTVDAAGTAVGWVTPAPTLIMAATAPNPVPADGAQWFDETGGGLYVAYKGAWVEVGGGGAKGPQVHIGAAPPTAADGNDGDYWAVYT